MKRFWLAARMLLLCFAGSAFAAPFQNGSFDIGAPTDPVNCYLFAIPAGSTVIPGWTVSVGDIDWVGPCNWPAQDGTHSLDLLGNGKIGGVQQTFDTIPGATYQVSFQLSGNPGPVPGNPPIKPLTVTVAGVTQNYTFDVTGIGLTNLQWTPKTFTFVASASTSTINFVSDMTSAANGFAGAALDNVHIVRINAVSIGPWTGRIGSATYSGADSVVNPGPVTSGVDIGSPPGLPPYPGTPIASAPMVVSDGTVTGLAEFTYATAPPFNNYCCHTGEWTLETIATTSGDVPVNWLYSGYHGTCQSRASLTAFIRRGGAVIYTNTVYSAYDAGCNGSPPAGGFNRQGQVVVPGVVAGDTYGFMMHASNYDANGEVQGKLTVSASPSTTTSLTSSTNPGTVGIAVSLLATVNGNNPTGVVNFTDQFGPISGCTGVPVVAFQALCTQSLALGTHQVVAAYSGDTNNAGSSSAPLAQVINAPAAATTTSLASAPNPANVGVGVTFTATVTTTVPGSNPTGTVRFINGVPDIPGCSAVPLTGAGDSRTAVCTTSSLTAGSWLISVLYSGDPNNQNSAGSTTQVISAGPTLATPSLIRVAATGGTGAFVIGRVDGASNIPITLQVSTASSCTSGALIGPTALPTVTPTTDAAGYFSASVSGVNPGNFVAVQVTSPTSTAASSCVASSGDNDFWPKAFDLGTVTTARDFIDAAGKARWYKFSVTPGQKIQVTLSGLPADYDLVVFKDINQAFVNQLVPTGAAALTKLSAEFAPSTFSPSTFSPSTFSPSTFSPDAYAPSTFSPSTFSPSTFSPSTFSPSTFSPSTFSPSTFSPSTFSPSTFSPSTFSPSTFSPSTFSPSSVLGLDPTQVAQSFSSAQTRSIIGVSATPGVGDESVVLNTWNNTGNFYVRVAGRGGAFSTAAQFTLSVAKGAETCTSVAPLAPIARSAGAAAVTTVILTDGSKIALDTALPNGGTLRAKLAALGVVIDVDGDARVRTLKAQAAANTACPYATNLVAEEIKSIVDSYRASNPLRYVVIAGNDGVIPFFRYPDESLLGQESGYVPPVRNSTPSDASLSRDYVLSQDAYGSSIRVAMRAIDFPIPGLAVGRLVETPEEIAGVIDAYLANAVVVPSSALVTGYDFLANVADAVKTELQTGGIAATQALITLKDVSPQDARSWTATQLGTALFGSRHDVVFLAGHFSANSALAADFTTSLLTTDLAASTTDFTNSIVFSAGCHAGYNIVDPDAIDGVTLKLDWPQAFAQKKATLIAGTGYQYGDTDFIEYSARLYRNFARQLRAGTTGSAISVGEALARAKSDYLATTPDIRGIHQKALLETTLYGLPMLGVNMTSGRDPNAATAGAITPSLVASGPAAQLGLKTYDYTVSPAFQTNTLSLTNLAGGNKTATWLSTPDGVVTNPAEPALPLVAANVTPTDQNLVLRGVGLLGGSYSESTIVPLTGAPTTELRGVHAPFLSPVFFPMRLWTPNYYGALAGTGGTKLLVTPAQHRAADVTQGTSTLRQFSGLNLRLYYSGNITATANSAAPTIVGVNAVSNGGGLTFAAQVHGDPAAAIHEVWVTYTSGSGPTGTWMSLPLTQCSATPPPVCGTTMDTQQWMGQLPPQSGSVKYIVQAVNGVGLVSADDNLGAYYSVGGVAPVATTLALLSPPAGAIYGDTVAIRAKLSAGATPVSSKLVTVSVGGASQTGVTDSNGNVTVNMAVSSLPGTFALTASFSGDDVLLPSSTSAVGFVVAKASSNLVTFSPLGVTLTGTIGGKTQPIDGSVAFSLTSTRGNKTVFAITNYLGQAILPPPGLPAGTYTITSASFGGNATYNATTFAFTGAFTIPKANQTISFGPLANKTYGDSDFAVTATTTSPLTVSLGASGSCTVTGLSVHITGAGTCTITASQVGSDDFNAATTVSQSFVIAKAVATATVGSLAPAYDGTAKAATATTIPSGLSVNFVYTQSGNPATPINAGSYLVTATVNDVNYQGSATATLTIAQATTTVTVTIGNATFDGNPHGGAASVTGAGLNASVPVSYAGADVTTTYGPSSTAPTSAGNYLATATYAGTANYLQSSASKAYTIAKATLIVSPTVSQPSLTYGDDLAPTPITVTYGSTYSGTLVCLLNSTPPILSGKPPATPPVPAGTYTITATIPATQVSPSCNPVVTNTATLTVSPAQATFANVAASLTAPARTTVSITGQLNRLGKPQIYPKAADLAGGAFAVALRNSAGTVKTYSPSLSDPNGTFTITDNSLAPDNYALEFNYTGGPNFLAATRFLSALRVVGFATGGSMSQARTSHTATLLNDGRVLVAGGVNVTDDRLRGIGTAEIYCPDPYTPPATPVRTLAQWCPNGVGKFSPAGRGNTTQIGVGNMVQARAFHTATLLPDGTVLLAGGYNQSDIFTSTAEIYDPTDPIADRFTAVGSLPSVVLAGYTATLISKNGKALVLVAGGLTASSQLYDPATKTWSLSGSMTGARFNHTASLVGVGGTKVLVAGGLDLRGTTLQTTTIYNVATGTFSSGPTMLAPRELHTATAIANGKVLLAGGTGGSNNTVALSPLAEIYDPANATTPFVPTGFASNTGRFAHSASALGTPNAPDGRVLIAGGSVGIACNQVLATSELYTSGFASGSAMAAARVSHTATVLKDGRVLIAGGIGVAGSSCAPLNTTEIWNAPPPP